MYRITFEQYPIYDPRGAELGLVVPSARLDTAVNRAGTLSLEMLADHPYIHHLTRMHGTMAVTQDGVTIFRGRIVRDSKDFYNRRAIECEGALAYLNDSVVPPYSYPEDYLADVGYQAAAESGNVVAFWLGKLIDGHNAQVSTAQQIKLGRVTVKDPNNYLYRNSKDYSTTWATITDKLSGSALGGYLLPRYEADGTYLDYLAELPIQSGQAVEYAKNLLDISGDTYGGNLYTAILPIGKDGLTIASVPDGSITDDVIKSGLLLYSKAAVAKYGKITAITKWDDVTETDNLKTKAVRALGVEGIPLPETITCKACDLHVVDGSIEAWHVGRNIKVMSALHGYSGYYPLTELAVDLLDPAGTTITMGRTVKGLSDAIAQTPKKAEAALSEAQDAQLSAATAQIAAGEARQMASGAADSVTVEEMRKTITEVNASLSELSAKLSTDYVLAANFGAYIKKINNEIVATPENVTQYYEFYSWLQNKINENSKAFDGYKVAVEGYVRTGIIYYTEDNAPVIGIAIGQNLTATEVDGETKIEQTGFRTTYSSQKMSFWEDRAEVGYISNQKLHINEITTQKINAGQWVVDTQNGFSVDWRG